jgi:FkbM family methyltransferase
MLKTAKRATLQALIRVLSSRGYDVWPPESNPEERALAVHLRHLFGSLRIDCVLDVGANRGQYRDFLRSQVGYTGMIHSFEPISSLAALLQSRSAGDRNWEIHPFALGSDDTRAAINVTAETMHSSFLTLDSEAVQDFVNVYREIGREQVAVRRLDAVMKERHSLADMRRIYLKMDTQGYDLEVVKGASDTLKRVCALQTEISVLPTYAGMPDGLTAICMLKKEGFEISGMYSVARDRRLRVIQFDCIMVADRKCT